MPMSMADAKIQARRQLAKKGGKKGDVDALAKKLVNKSNVESSYEGPHGKSPTRTIRRGGGDEVTYQSGTRGDLSNYLDKIIQIGGVLDEGAQNPRNQPGPSTGNPEETTAIPTSAPDQGGGNPDEEVAPVKDIPLVPGFSWTEVMGGAAGMAALYAAYRWLRSGGRPPANPDTTTPGERITPADPIEPDSGGGNAIEAQRGEQRALTTPDSDITRASLPAIAEPERPADIAEADWEYIRSLPEIEQQKMLAVLENSRAGIGSNTVPQVSSEERAALTSQSPQAQITDQRQRLLTDQRGADAQAQQSVEQGGGERSSQPRYGGGTLDTIDQQLGGGGEFDPATYQSLVERAAKLPTKQARSSYLRMQDIPNDVVQQILDQLTKDAVRHRIKVGVK